MRDILEGPGAAALPLEDGYIGTFDLWASETAIVGRKGIGIHAKFKFRLSRPPGSQCLVFFVLASAFTCPHKHKSRPSRPGLAAQIDCISQDGYPLQYITLHYITSHYITLHCIALHYIKFITLH